MRLTTGVALLAGLLAGVIAGWHSGAEVTRALDRALITSLEVQHCTKAPRR